MPDSDRHGGNWIDRLTVEAWFRAVDVFETMAKNAIRDRDVEEIERINIVFGLLRRRAVDLGLAPGDGKNFDA